MSYRINSHISSDIDVPSYEKRLSICLRSNGFSFSITTKKGLLLTFGEVVHEGASDMMTLSADIKFFFETQNIQPFSFDYVELIVTSDISTWIPDELYSGELKSDYLNLLGFTVPLGSMVYEDITTMGAHCLFVAESEIVTSFKIAIPGITIRSQFSKFSEVEMAKSNHPSILMYVRGGKVDIVAYSNAQLLLSNTFDVANVNELLSKGLDVMHQLQIESPSTTLYLSGDVGRDTYKALCNYFPQVKLYGGRQFQFGNPSFQHLHSYQYVLNLI